MKRIGLLLAVWLLLGGLCAQQPSTYLVSDFKGEALEEMLDLCEKGGLSGLLQRTPFSSFGYYEWHPDFAPEGDRSVARMVERAQERGVQLGIFAQTDAISLNDAYFSPRYYARLRRAGQVTLFHDIDAEQGAFAVDPSEVFSQPSTLNLLLVEGEMIAYGTMEPAQESVILYRCARGAYGTVASDHGTRAEAYKLWDSPGRFVAPDGSLRDSVRWHLAQRIEAARLPFVLYSDAPGMNWVDGTVRVRQVEAWEQEREDYRARTAAETDLAAAWSLGWYGIHASEGRQPATTLEELEWFLSKAAAFDAGYGLVIDRSAVQRHGLLDRMMALVKAWNAVRDAGILTEQQKEDLKDPYQDWHLEPFGEDSFLLYPIRQSRGYRCPAVKGPALANWQWKASERCNLALCVEVKGKGEIRNPSLVLGADTLRFPCAVKAGQRLLCGFNGTLRIVDADWHTIKERSVEGLPMLPEGETEVAFTYEARGADKAPEVIVRYQTRETPIPLQLPSERVRPNPLE